MQNQDSFQGQSSPLIFAGDILDDSMLSGTLGSAASDTLTPVMLGPAMMPTQACTGIDGANVDLLDSSESVVDQGLSGLVSLYQDGRTSAQNLFDKVIEVPVVNTAMQTSAGLASSASEVAGQTIDFTKAKAQEVVSSVRGLASTASKNWNAPDNQAHNALKEQTGRFVDGLSQLATTVDDSDRMDKVRQHLDKATDYFSNLADGVYSELGYVDSPSGGPQEAELAAAERRLKENLIDLRNSSDFLSTLESAFGDRWEPAEAEALVDDFTSGKAAPRIEVVAADALQGEAAYGDNTIFISEQYLANSATQPEALDAVLLEEAGHYLDDQLNETDSAGDEGAIFAKLAKDETISAAELTALRNEDDHAKLWFENREIDVENFDIGGSLSSFGSSVSDSLSSFGSSAVDSLSSFGSSAADSLSSFGSSAVDTLSDFGSSASDSLSSFGSSAVDTLSDFGSSATDSLSSFGSSASDSLSSFGSSAVDTLSDFGSSASDSLSSYGSSAVDTLSDFGSSASDSLSSFGSSASDSLSSFGSSAYNGLSSGLSSLGSSASDSLSSFGSSAYTGLSSGLSSLGSSASDSLSSFGSSASDSLNNFGSSASDSLSSFGSSAYNGLSDFGSSASDSLNSFGSSAYNSLSDFGSSASNSLNNFGSSVSDIWNSASDTTFDAFNSFGNTAADTWNSVTETAGAATDYVADTVDTVTNTATDALGTATDYVADTATAVTDAAVDTTTAVTDFVADTATTATDAVVGAVDTASQTATDAWNGVTETAANAWDGVTEVATTATDYVADGAAVVTDAAVDTATAVTDFVADTATTATDAVVGAVDTASQTATDAWNGVTETAANVWDGVTEVATTATDYVADGAAVVTDAAVDTTTAVTDFVADSATAATDAVVEGAIATSDYIGETLEPVADFTAEVATSVGDTVSDATTAITEFATEDVPQWIAENESTVNRGVGVLQTIGGVGEMFAGAALVPTGAVSFGAGTVAGVGVAAHGADTTWAGLKAIWTGEAQETYTQQGITAVADAIPGVSTETAESVGAWGDLGLGFAGSVASLPKLLAGGADNVLDDAAAAAARTNADNAAVDNAAAAALANVDNAAAATIDDAANGAIRATTDDAAATAKVAADDAAATAAKVAADDAAATAAKVAADDAAATAAKVAADDAAATAAKVAADDAAAAAAKVAADDAAATAAKVAADDAADSAIGTIKPDGFIDDAANGVDDLLTDGNPASKANPSDGPQCFIAGTAILTSEGKKNIDELRTGDYVLSWDEETGKVIECPVTEWYRREALAIMDIFIGTEKISCTTDHPFWVKDKWVLAYQLTAGTVLQTHAGDSLTIDEVRRRDDVTQVYNVEIDGLHTYFVSSLEILSHNMCGGVDESLISSKRQDHILDGDATGGGHRPGLGISGKTEFPAGWSDDKILENIIDVATDPNATWTQLTGSSGNRYTRSGKPVRWKVEGTRENIDIRAIVEPDGEGIISGFPTNTPANP